MAQINLSTRFCRLTDIENRLVVAKGAGGGGRGVDWEFGVSRCKLLYLERKSNEVLLSSMGKYNQISWVLVYHDGKEYKREMYNICTTESLSCTAKIGTTL